MLPGDINPKFRNLGIVLVLVVVLKAALGQRLERSCPKFLRGKQRRKEMLQMLEKMHALFISDPASF
jgi:hypothetical protein